MAWLFLSRGLDWACALGIINAMSRRGEQELAVQNHSWLRSLVKDFRYETC